MNKFGEQGSWRKIAQKLGGRTALQCFQKWRKIQLDREKGRAWSAAEDQQLLNAVKLIQTDECLGVSWNAVAHHVPGTVPIISYFCTFVHFYKFVYVVV